jgi:DNA polymerase-4
VRAAGSATILHADLDAFYASVEQLLDPTLAGQPIAVGGGVVLAASYEARAHGVQGGMPSWRARQLCPSIEFVTGHFHEYQRLGDAVMEVFNDFTPLVERISIDEGFLDVAGATHLFGSPRSIAVSIRQRVLDEIGLPVSVGVARTKHLAKVASQVAKPDGLVVVEPEDERAFLDPLPVGLIWGVGRVTQDLLHRAGIDTIGELSTTDSSILEHLVGKASGAKLGSLSANIDPRRVGRPQRAKSVGAQSALGLRLTTPALVRETVGYLADRVAARLRGGNQAGKTITIRVRFAHLRSVTRSLTLPAPVCATLTLAEVATQLVEAALSDHPAEREISLLAVSVSNLSDQNSLQLELPICPGGDDAERRPGSQTGAARWGADRSVDAIREKFGRAAVGYAGIVLSDANRVPEEFRELAERPLPD